MEMQPEITEIDTVLKWIDTNKQQGKILVCFFVDRIDKNPDEYFRYIARELGDSEFTFMTLLSGNEARANISGQQFRLRKEDIALLEGIDIIMLMNWATAGHKFPDEARVVSFCHSFGAYEHYNYVGYVGVQRNCDAFFTTSDAICSDAQDIISAHKGMCDPRFLLRRGSFRYMATGCPRIAALWDKLQKTTVDLDTLLYAPVGDYDNPGERRNAAFALYGEQLVADLLESFPAYRLLYRPCFSTWGHEPYEAIIRKFSGHPRFVVSRNTDHAPDFTRAAVCITEYSNIGEVFAFATLRPEIRRTFDTPYAVPQVMRTGLAQSPAGDIVSAVRTALDKPTGFWRKHIAESFGSYIIHPDETVGRIRQCLLALAGRAQFPPCVEIPRNSLLPAWSQAYYLHQTLRDSKINVRLLRDWMSVFPDDAVPVALRLLAGMRGDDQLTIMGDGWVTEDILQLLREKGGFFCQQDTPYAHVPVDTPASLLRYGYELALKEEKHDYVELLRNLRLS